MTLVQNRPTISTSGGYFLKFVRKEDQSMKSENYKKLQRQRADFIPRQDSIAVELFPLVSAIDDPSLDTFVVPKRHCVFQRSQHGRPNSHSGFYFYRMDICAMLNDKINFLSTMCPPEIKRKASAGIKLLFCKF